MAVDMDTLKELLENGLPNADICIDDIRGDGEHYAAHIESELFAGKNRVQQHQMVYQALQGKMASELHALQIHTKEKQ